MSVLLDGASYLSGLAPLSSAPFTVNIWYKAQSALNQNQTCWSITDNSVDNQFWRGFLADAAADQLRFQINSGTAVQAEIIGPFNFNTWEMLTCVEAAPNDHRLYWNGADRDNEGASRTPLNATSLAVGVNFRNSLQHFFDGNLAEVSIWPQVLSDAQVLALYTDNDIPAGRVFYASYRNSFASEIGADLSPTGSVSISADHPPVGAPGPDPPVPYTAWQPALLRDCWTTPNGADLKRSHTTDSYSGGNPSAATDLKSSIVDYATGNLKSGLTVRGNIKSSILKPT